MNDQASDPRSWSVDRVVYEFCHNDRPPWLARGLSIIHNSKLEEALRDNDVSGDILLDLTPDDLKNELGIKSLGQRKAIERVIKFLNGQPQASATPAPFTINEKVSKYVEGMPTPDLSKVSPPEPSAAWDSVHGGDLQASAATPFAESMLVRPRQQSTHAQDRRTSFGVVDTIERKGTNESPLFSKSRLSNATPTSDVQPSNQLDLQSNLPAVGSTLSRTVDDSRNEQLFSPRPKSEPHRGFLDTLESAIDKNLDVGKAGAVSNVLKSGPIIEQVADDKPKGKRRVAPTYVGPIQRLDAVTTNLSQSVPYLGHQVLALQDTFYGDDMDSDEEVNFTGQDCPAASGMIISKRLKNFFREPIRVVTSLSYPAQAKVPYAPSSCLGPFSEPYFTLFAQNASPSTQSLKDWPAIQAAVLGAKRSHWSSTKLLKDAIVGKRGGDSIPGLLPYPSPSDDKDDLGDYAYLLDKYPVAAEDDDNGSLPPYGDSGDENDFDEETWREIENERQEQQTASNFLSKEEVKAAMDAAVEQFREAWRTRKMVKAQMKAYRLWMRVAKAKKRQGEVDAYYALQGHKAASMAKMQDLILTDRWRTADQVKQQCDVLEETVFQLMEAELILHTLHQDAAPQKPEIQSRKRPTREKQVLPEGEEDLDSDSEVEDADRGVDNFVIEDDDLAMLDDPLDQDFNPIVPRGPNRERVNGNPLQGETGTQQDDAAVAVPVAAAVTYPDSPVVDFDNDISDTDLLSASILDEEQEEILSLPELPAEITDNDADAESDAEDDNILNSIQKRRSSKKHYSPNRAAKQEEWSSSPPAGDPESDDDNSDIDAVNRLPKTIYKAKGKTRESAIELLSSDPAQPGDESAGGYSIQTPSLNPTEDDSDGEPIAKKKTPNAPFRRSQSSTQPQSSAVIADPDAAERSSFLESALNSIPSDEIESVRVLFASVTAHEDPKAGGMSKFLNAGLVEMADSANHGPLKIPGIRKTDLPPAELLLALFMSYVRKRDLVRNEASQADIIFSHSNLKQHDKGFKRALENSFSFFDNSNAHATSTNKDPNNSKRGKKRKFVSIDSDDVGHTITEDSDLIELDSSEEPLHQTPHKKRKKKVAESQEARAIQKGDQERIREQEIRQQKLAQKLQNFDANMGVTCVVNSEEPAILLDPYISSRVKPHQILGIQFLWREIIDDPRHQGCLLAHTMGLGKTMQVISLIISIAQSAANEDPDVVEQIPQHLRQNRTLILCPPALLENWHDELLMWCPTSVSEMFGDIYKITGRSEENVTRIQTWAEGQGVLIISYDTLRSLITPAKSAKEEYRDLVPQYEPNMRFIHEPNPYKTL